MLFIHIHGVINLLPNERVHFLSIKCSSIQSSLNGLRNLLNITWRPLISLNQGFNWFYIWLRLNTYKIKIMKTLKTMLCLLLVSTALTMGCKKDKDDNPESGQNNYVYQEVTTKIASSNSLVATVLGVNTLSIVLKGEGTSKWVQLYFYKTGTIPTGDFTYKSNLDNSYNPAINFSGGTIKLDITNSHEMTGGKVNISKYGDNYTVKVDGATSRGAVKASYVGKITP